MPLHLTFGYGKDRIEGVEASAFNVIIDFKDELMFADTNLEIIKGTTKTLPYFVENQDHKPVDLAGSKIWFTAKNQSYLSIDNDTNIILQLRNSIAGGSDSEILITDLVDGIYPKFEVYIAPNSLQTIPVAEYFYDVKIGFPDGTIKVIQRGKFKITYRVTASMT